MRDGRKLRGLIPGGASTDFLSAEQLDVKLDFDSVAKAGSRLGTGTMVVLDDHTCPVGMVLSLEKFFARESCGWCTPCREGLPWVARILEALEQGKGEMSDLEILEQHARLLAPGRTFCALAPGRGGAPAERAAALPRGLRTARAAEEVPLEMKTFTLTIDGRQYAVDAEGKNLLHVCLSLGFNLPYFCWHPALHSVGACRQCAVKLFKDEADTQGRIVMSCMTPVADGMRVSVEDPEARAFRGSVTEWLMVNHPHDCPVCDEGGECHLQDMTVMTGHTYRRYRFTKRTHRNQDLGPFVNHEMNRCIACYRCVRFYRDYAGGTRPGGARRARLRLLRPRRATAPWKTSSAATSSRSARPASSPTRR